MYLYDYKNGKTEVGGGSVEVDFYVDDYYSIDYECPLCDGSGNVTATAMEDESEHEITCPHCNGDGRIYDEVHVSVETSEEVEISGRKVGAYCDENLYYSNREVQDRIDDDVFKLTLEKMIEKRRAEKLASLTAEDLEKVNSVQEMEKALAEMMKQFQEAKALANSLLDDEDEVKPLRIGDRVKIAGVNKVGELVEDDKTDVPYLVRFDDCTSDWYRAERVSRA